MSLTYFDHFLTTEEMALELKPSVGILRDKYPKKNLGKLDKSSDEVRSSQDSLRTAVSRVRDSTGHKIF